LGYYENNFTKKLELLLEEICGEIASIKSQISELPEGRLHRRNRGGKQFYKVYKDGKEYGITKDKEMIKKLELKRDLEKAQAKLISEKYTVERALKKHVEAPGDDILPKLWLEEPYEKYSAYENTLIYKTKSGILVRSKSERIIADLLYEYGLPFKYECSIECDGEILWPDFTIRKRNGEIVLWEHMGLMNRPDYYYRNIEKIKKYRALGFVQHKNLICTWEEDLYNLDDVRKIIEMFLL